MSLHPHPDPLEPGQESVWAYPRPPRLEPALHRIQMVLDGRTICDTDRALRVLETSHPPTYYVPIEAFGDGILTPSSVGGGSFCEWKGKARYFDLVGPRSRHERAAWGYPAPSPAFAGIADHVAVYLWALDEGLVGGERAYPQPGGFYGGWITSHVAGPFKGAPGTMGW